MSSIQLDPTHGVNPSIIQCFFCMKDVGVALLGKIHPKTRKAFAEAGLYGPGHESDEAPRKLCLDKEPCNECSGFMDQGVIFVSVRNEDDGKENPFRTGGFAVMSEDFIRRVVNPVELQEELLEKRFAFVPDEVWDKLGLPRPSDGMPTE